MVGGGQDEEGASDKRGAVTRLANDPAVASHLKILVICRVIVHYFFIRTTLNGIASTRRRRQESPFNRYFVHID